MNLLLESWKSRTSPTFWTNRKKFCVWQREKTFSPLVSAKKWRNFMASQKTILYEKSKIQLYQPLRLIRWFIKNCWHGLVWWYLNNTSKCDHVARGLKLLNWFLSWIKRFKQTPKYVLTLLYVTYDQKVPKLTQRENTMLPV